MMMKNPLFSPRGLALLALSVALAGCPALDTLTLADPKPDPSPSASPSPGDKDEDPKEDPKDPAFAIKALGPVRAQLQGAIDVEHGPFTARLQVNSDPYTFDELHRFGQLGTLGVWSHGAPAGNHYKPRAGVENVYDRIYAYGTHYFASLSGHELLAPGALTFKIGEVAPLAERRTADSIELDFPGGTRGALTATPTDSQLMFFTRQDGAYKHQASSTVPLANLDDDITRSATLSVTVAVQELDGTPSTGLTAANFRLSEARSGRDQRSAIQAKETAAGVYRLTMPFDGMRGHAPEPQRHMLTVTHATLTTTHVRPTPPPSEQP